MSVECLTKQREMRGKETNSGPRLFSGLDVAVGGEEAVELVERFLRLETLLLREDGEELVGDDLAIVSVQISSFLGIDRGVEHVSPALDISDDVGVAGVGQSGPGEGHLGTCFLFFLFFGVLFVEVFLRVVERRGLFRFNDVFKAMGLVVVLRLSEAQMLFRLQMLLGEKTLVRDKLTGAVGPEELTRDC